MLLFFKCAVPGIPNLNLPDVCTSTSAYASAFCREHCELLNREAPAIKTNLKEFLQHCIYYHALMKVHNIHISATLAEYIIGQLVHDIYVMLYMWFVCMRSDFSS